MRNVSMSLEDMGVNARLDTNLDLIERRAEVCLFVFDLIMTTTMGNVFSLLTE